MSRPKLREIQEDLTEIKTNSDDEYSWATIAMARQVASLYRIGASGHPVPTSKGLEQTGMRWSELMKLAAYLFDPGATT